MIISLTGFMGCGKSSVGKELQALLCCNLIDLDTYIEEKEGKKIPEIFAEQGEPAFRKMELDCLSEIVNAHDPKDFVILSLGGGTIMTPACAEIVKASTTCIYLQAQIETLVSVLTGGEVEKRPMLSGATDVRKRIEDLMQKRADVYKTTAHHIVDIENLSYAEIASKIADLIR